MTNKHYHFKLYKPFGMLSQLASNNPREIRTKRFLTELYDFPKGTMPVGRLDEKSEGLLLLTTDGKLSDAINRNGIDKEYLAQLDGRITEEAVENLKKGVEIGFDGKKYKTIKCEVSIIAVPENLPVPSSKLRIGRHRPNSWIRIVLKEGKFRQIRKMTAAVGFPTIRLIRIRVGNIKLKPLSPAEVQETRLENICNPV